MTGTQGRADVLLVGADDVTLCAFAGALEDDPDIGPVIRAPDPFSAGPLAARAAVTLLDATLLDANGTIGAIAALQVAAPATGIVVIAPSAEPALVRSVLDAGAATLLLASAEPRQVRATVRAALDGHGVLDVAVVRPVIDIYAVLLAEARRRDRAIIESLAAAVEAKDSVTSRHLHAVSRLACKLAGLIEPALGDTDDFLFGCLLHDVGKIGVPEEILTKPGPLTEDEWQIMRRHPDIGAGVVQPLNLSPTVTAVVRHHHERWDGSGYPDGLSGEEIPLAARIFSVCDALEAMTAPRPYREPLTPQDALERIRGATGEQFDPSVVATLDRGVRAGALSILPDAPPARPERRLRRRSASARR